MVARLFTSLCMQRESVSTERQTETFWSCLYMGGGSVPRSVKHRERNGRHRPEGNDRSLYRKWEVRRAIWRVWGADFSFVHGEDATC